MTDEPAYTPQDRTDDHDHEDTERPRRTPQGRTDEKDADQPPRD